VAGPEGLVAEASVVSEGGHSRWLLPAVDALLHGLGLAASSLDLFAVTTGPGSFTGLRVGLGSVQGLALASGRRCLGVSTLDVLAHTAQGSAGTIVALVDAFRGEVFSAVYDGEARLRRERQLGTLAATLDGLPPGTAFVGDAGTANRATIQAAVAGALFPPTSGFLAASLALLALRRAPEAVPPSELRPLYLRAADIRPSRA